MQINKDLYPGVLYDYNNGLFYRLNADGSKDRRLVTDFFDMITYVCAFTKKNVKKKAAVLAWEIMNGKLPKDHKVYQKDFNRNNYQLYNIGCVSARKFVSITDAVYNLKGGVRVVPHPNDAYIYFVQYKVQGKIKRKRCHDIVQALRIKRMVQINSTKVLGRYTLTN